MGEGGSYSKYRIRLIYEERFYSSRDKVDAFQSERHNRRRSKVLL
jgi:hypothetical protein